MNLQKSTLLVLALGLSNGVNASLIDNGDYFTDTQSGLDWLKFDLFDDYGKWNSIKGEKDYFGGSWEYADTSQMINLLDGQGWSGSPPTYRGIRYNLQGEEYAEAVSFLRMATNGNDRYRTAAYLSGNSNAPFGRSAWFECGYSYGRGECEFEIVDVSHDYYGYVPSGYFMTRASVVPIPAAAWLFGSGLLGLVATARRKTNA